MKRRRRDKSLDLHGVRHQDAADLVENWALLNDPPMDVITGNSGEMKRIVREVLDRHGFKYIDGPPWNMGIIHIIS